MQVSIVVFISSLAATAVACALAGYAWRSRSGAGPAGRIAIRRPPSASYPPSTELFDAIADGVIVGEGDGRLTYWNPAALQLHGFSTLDEVLRHVVDFKDVFRITYAADGRVVPFEQWPVAKLLRGEEVRDYELKVRRTDTGRERVIRYSGVFADNGGARATRRVVLTLHDVTDLRRSESALRQSEIHLREMIESLPQLVWTCRGEDGSCDYVSPQFVDYTGVPVERQLGFGWLEQLHPDDRARAMSEWGRAAAECRPFDVEFRIRRADDAYRWFKTRARPLRGGTGQVIKWFGTNTDIHDQRLAAESVEVLAAIVENTDDAIIGTTLDGTITSWNRAAERMYGYAATDAVGRDVRMLSPNGERGGEHDAFMRQVATGRGVEHVESQRVTRDGRVIDVALTISPIRNASGAVTGASKISRDVTRAKRDAQALRASETRFRTLAASMPQIVWTRDPAGQTTYLNDRWFEATGLSSVEPEEVVRALHPDDLSVREAASAARAAGEPYQFEFRLRHVGAAERDAGADPAGRRVPDAEYRWFLGRAVPVRDAAGQITEWFGTSTDIDDVKRAERELRSSHALLRAVVEGITDPVYAKDIEGRYLLANSALAESVGRSASEVIGATDRDLFGDERAGPIVEADRRILAFDIPQTFEESVSVTADGGVTRTRHYLTTKARHLDADGAVAGVLGIARDITSRKWAEQAIQDSEQHLRGVLDRLLVFVAVLNPAGGLTGLNRVAREGLAAYGVRADELLGQPTFDAHIPGQTAAVRSALQAAVARAAAGEEVHLEAVRLIEGPGTFDADLMVAPMRNREGDITHLIISGVDVTGRERAARQARERQTELAHLDRVRTMGQMAAGLAHELNQPLGAISNYAGACRRAIDSGNPAAREMVVAALADVQGEALRAGAIIRRLRGFVGKQQPRAEPVDANFLVNESLRLFAFDFRQAGVEPHVELADGLPPVMADAVQVGQVLINLIRNALDAMSAVEPGCRRLEVETGLAASGQVRFAVRDRGCGVAPHDLGRVFDAFYTTKAQGMGIGLSLCRTIIEDHGGHLAAEPNRDGEDGCGGMTFTFTLKAAASAISEPLLAAHGTWEG